MNYAYIQALTKKLNLEKAKNALVKFSLDHSETVNIGINIASSLHHFALTKSPLSLIEGGVRSIWNLSNSLTGYSYNYFSQENGWERLISSADDDTFYTMFSPILKTFPFKHLEFKYDCRESDGIYSLPIADIGYDRHAVYFQRAKISREKLLQFFITKKMEKLKSNFFSITSEVDRGSSTTWNTKYNFDLRDEPLRNIKSETSDHYTQYIKSFLDKKIHRSILFTGAPGAGKTTIAQTVVGNLNLRTLKFKYNWKNTNLAVIQLLLDALKVDVVILDDFDQTAESTQLLEFLEWIHDNTQLVIAITNSLKTFHPAILRPGRIDEIFTINHLDPEVVKTILAEAHHGLAEQIKHWPVAYINELNCRLINNPELNLNKNIVELNDRVEKQLLALK